MQNEVDSKSTGSSWQDQVTDIEALLSFDEALRDAHHLVTSRRYADAARHLQQLDARVTTLRSDHCPDVSKNMRIELRLLRENLLLTLSERWSEQVRMEGAPRCLLVCRNADALSDLATAMHSLDALNTAINTFATKVHEHFLVKLFVTTTNMEVTCKSNDTHHTCSLVTSASRVEPEQVLQRIQEVFKFLHECFECV